MKKILKIFLPSNFYQKLAIFLLGGLLLLSPALTKAGTWTQETQQDFGKGTADSGLEIKNGDVKLLDGIIYEDAEDGNTAHWDVYDQTPPGTITNVYDNDLKSNVIVLDNNQAGINTGYRYQSPHQKFFMAQMKIKSPGPLSIYFHVNTTIGHHRYIQLLVANGQDRKSGSYLEYYLGSSLANDKWHTIDRNLEDDLHKFEPNNDITKLNGIYFRGGGQIDDIYFYPGKSTYTSPILNLGKNKVSSFEKINWETNAPSGAEIALQTRTSADGKNWSGWSKEYTTAAGEKVKSSTNQYLQYQANFDANTVVSVPALKKVAIEYNRFPLAPTNFSPENDKKLTVEDQLKWGGATDPDSEDSLTYTLEIDDNSQFQSLNSTTTGLKTTEIKIKDADNFSNLQDEVNYYWRVKTVDDHNTQSDYAADKKNFVLDRANLQPKSPQSGFNPHQDGKVKTQKPIIYWGTGSDPDTADPAATLSYIIQLDDSAKFDSAGLYTTKSGTTQLAVPDTLEDNTQYYYRIKTKDDEGVESNWSVAQSFIVVTGKNPVISVTKTVEVKPDNQKISLLVGGLATILGKLEKPNYWFILPLILLTLLFFRKYIITSAFQLIPVKTKSCLKNNRALSNIDSGLLPPNLDPRNSVQRTVTKVKGVQTKTIIAVLLAGGAALAAAAIYYYQANPSPYKDDGKETQVGDELTYRIDFKNGGETQATNFNVIDNIPKGTTYVEDSSIVNGTAQTDQLDSDYLSFSADKLNFKVGEILPNTNGYVAFKVKVSSVPENKKVTNSADITFNESDGVQTTNETANQLVGDVTASTGEIKGLVWHDSDGDQAKSDQEAALEKMALELYQDVNANGTLETDNDTLVKTTTTNSDGSYGFTNLATGTYLVKLDETTLLTESSITTDNNPQVIKVDGKEYSGINFGVSLPEDALIVAGPTSSIGNLVWDDNDKDGSKDANEAGLQNVNVKLFEDTNDNDTLEEDSDFFVVSQKTDANGNYKFTGLAANNYLTLVDENTIPNDYQLTTANNPKSVKLESNNQEYNVADFGYSASGEEITDDEKVETITSLPKSVGGPTLITTSKDAKKPNTVAITPLEVSQKVGQGEVVPPFLTHIGTAEIDDFNKKFSINLDEDLTFKGKTGPDFVVTLFIHSDLNLKTATTANQDGLWEVVVNSKLFEAGEHKVFAQTKDLEDNLSEKVEIARFEVNREKTDKAGGNTVYWIALLALLVVAATIVAITWIKDRKKK